MISANANIEFPMPVSSSEIIFRKKALHKYIHIYAHIEMQKSLFPNTIYELGIDIVSPFLGMALIAVWKRALHIFYTPFAVSLAFAATIV